MISEDDDDDEVIIDSDEDGDEFQVVAGSKKRTRAPATRAAAAGKAATTGAPGPSTVASQPVVAKRQLPASIVSRFMVFQHPCMHERGGWGAVVAPSNSNGQ